MSKHEKILVMDTMTTLPGKVRRAAQTVEEVREAVEPILVHAGLLERAPFRSITLILVLGRVDADIPAYEPIDPSEKDLPLAMELDMAKLLKASRGELYSSFMVATLTALIHAAKKHGLPADALERCLKDTPEEPAGPPSHARLAN